MFTYLTKLFLALALATVTAVSASADISNLPDLGDQSAALISPYQERSLGEEFMRKARQFWDIPDDAELNEYIQALGERLVRISDAPDKDFHFFIVADPTINAFAVPGGKIGVHTGLILAAKDEAELAAVMAHEIAHITQRHIPRMIAESRQSAVPAMAALIAALVLAGSSGAGGEALATLAGAAYAQNQLNFSRAFEQEADRIGITILAKAGLDARAMPTFFERLQAWNRLNESNLPEFLRTHPITTNRISESRDRAERYSPPARTKNDEFFHVQQKIRAHAKGNPKDIVRTFEKTLKEERGGPAQQYGYALALLRDRQLDRARTQAAALVKGDTARVSYRILQADIALASGHADHAIQLYADTLKYHPTSFALKRRYAEALLANGRAHKARDVLRSLVREYPHEPALHKLLARTEGEAGDTVQAHRAMAEHYYLSGNRETAVQQLELALRFAKKDFYASAGIEARMKEIKDEIALWR